MHPAVGGESGPFTDPQTKMREADPKRLLWVALTARHCGKREDKVKLADQDPPAVQLRKQGKGHLGYMVI